MAKEKKILVTRQKLERIVIRRGESDGKYLSCAVCGGQNPMLAIEQSGLVCGIPTRAVFRLLETEQIHFAELPSGSLLVCIASLQAEVQKTKH